MLPPELEQPAPRDLSLVERLIAKNRALTKNLYIWSFVCIPLMAFIFWYKWGNDDVLNGAYIGAGITALCMLWGYAMDVNTKRSIKLYQLGKAVVGKVTKIQAPADRNNNAYILTYVEYKISNGNRFKGHAGTSGKQYEVDLKVGDDISVLYMDEQPGKFAIYSPGVGMATGLAKRIE